uniref:Uncharacterized protein n=1 Tax=Ochrobactrum phage ORM_20 TaxID=2985243 RepID=A0A9N6WTN0_9VIRU|nr:hypothetical protein ORM20_00101 [Ochrobactrum phage ORM_20]
MAEENNVPDPEEVGGENPVAPMSFQVVDSDEADEVAVVKNSDFHVTAADTDVAAYLTRVKGLVTAACATIPGINSILGLYQPFYECFVDRNRKFHKSQALIDKQLTAIYHNDKTYELYTHIPEAVVTPPEGGEGE